MTDNEIMKNLRCCADRYCKNCTEQGKPHCKETVAAFAWDLMYNQKTEIERLKKECGNQSALWSKHYEGIFETAKETIRAEAIKEFAERLKNKLTSCSKAIDGKSEYLVCDFDIDSLVKEMVGE